MPHKIVMADTDELPGQGVEISWANSSGCLLMSAFYDGGGLGVAGGALPLGELFARLGITERDCRKALREAQRLRPRVCVKCREMVAPGAGYVTASDERLCEACGKARGG